MTDRTDHYAAAQRELTFEWQLGMEPPNYARATAHALLAVVDALTAKPCDDCARHDAYAANEAEQREGMLEDAWQFRDWETVEHLQDEERQREALGIAEPRIEPTDAERCACCGLPHTAPEDDDR